jgi:hypothetical protein
MLDFFMENDFYGLLAKLLGASYVFSASTKGSSLITPPFLSNQMLSPHK